MKLHIPAKLYYVEGHSLAMADIEGYFASVADVEMYITNSFSDVKFDPALLTNVEMCLTTLADVETHPVVLGDVEMIYTKFADAEGHFLKSAKAVRHSAVRFMSADTEIHFTTLTNDEMHPATLIDVLLCLLMPKDILQFWLILK